MPLFSIITVTYNAEQFIEQSILSVLGQTFTNFQYIIIDGNSSDSTVAIINKHLNDCVCLISEKDDGIYDAMNKALNIATGEYVFFLGADDCFKDEFILQDVAAIIDNNSDFICGNVMYNTGAKFVSKFNFKTLLNNTIHHQGVFYKKSLFDKFRYDTQFKLIADYEFNLILYLNRKKLKYKFIDKIITVCNDNGASRSQLALAYDETNKVRAKVLGGRSVLLKMIYYIKFYLTEHVI